LKYSFGKDEKGWLKITIPPLSDKGATPTEAENLIKQLLKKVNGKGYENIYNVDINPRYTRKLSDALIDDIKERESKYRRDDCTNGLNKFDYYAYTLCALQKLRYLDENGKAVSQVGFSRTFGLRRPTLSKYLAKLQSYENDPIYLEIERRICFFDK